MARKRQTKESVVSSLEQLLRQKRPPSPRLFDLINDAIAWIGELDELEQGLREIENCYWNVPGGNNQSAEDAATWMSTKATELLTPEDSDHECSITIET